MFTLTISYSTVIKNSLLLSNYGNLLVVQNGEFGMGSLLGIRVFQMISSPNSSNIIYLWWVGIMFKTRGLTLISLPKVNLTKPRKLLNPEVSWTKPKGVTTQMKVLNECFLMEVFTLLLLNRVRVCLFFWTEKHGSTRVQAYYFTLDHVSCTVRNSKLPSFSQVQHPSICPWWLTLQNWNTKDVSISPESC